MNFASTNSAYALHSKSTFATTQRKCIFVCPVRLATSPFAAGAPHPPSSSFTWRHRHSPPGHHIRCLHFYPFAPAARGESSAAGLARGATSTVGLSRGASSSEASSAVYGGGSGDVLGDLRRGYGGRLGDGEAGATTSVCLLSFGRAGATTGGCLLSFGRAGVTTGGCLLDFGRTGAAARRRRTPWRRTGSEIHHSCPSSPAMPPFLSSTGAGSGPTSSSVSASDRPTFVDTDLRLAALTFLPLLRSERPQAASVGDGAEAQAAWMKCLQERGRAFLHLLSPTQNASPLGRLCWRPILWCIVTLLSQICFCKLLLESALVDVFD
jgi:hypothetical protein